MMLSSSQRCSVQRRVSGPRWPSVMVSSLAKRRRRRAPFAHLSCSRIQSPTSGRYLYGMLLQTWLPSSYITRVALADSAATRSASCQGMRRSSLPNTTLSFRADEGGLTSSCDARQGRRRRGQPAALCVGLEAPLHSGRMADEPTLESTALEVADAFAANELFQERGWTDGLPIVPPTEGNVRTFLGSAGLSPADVIGTEPVRRRRITAEKVAIAAVMAGCRADYLPVVVAVVKAMCQPQFSLHGSTASTGGSAPFIVVNGPIRQAIGMNATHKILANGSRANATIGRAVRLLIINVLGGVPGQLDR